MLRDVIDEDLPILFAYQRDPALNHRCDTPPREEEEFLDRMSTFRTDPTIFVRSIVHEEAVVGIANRFERDGETQLGYWIGRAFWGRGITTLAIKEFLQIDPTRPIIAHVVKDNLASLRVLQKNGFVIFDEYTEKAWYRSGDVELWKLRLEE